MMKRLVIAGLVMALLVCAAPAMGAELLAGQDIDVGDVNAVLEGDTLHVTYDTVDGWAMTETHLAIGTVVGDTCIGIPMTKKGNPIPGQFPYGSPYDPPVTSDSFDVEVGGLCSVVGTWTWTYFLGGGAYEHTMIIDEVQSDGDIIGHGYYNPNPGYTWTLTGTVSPDGDYIRFTILYTGLNSGYTVTGRGAINDCTSMSGVATGPATWDATRQSGSGLCVAAHAAVIHIADEQECQDLYSDATTMVMDSYAGGQVTPGAVKSFPGMYPFAAVPAWVHPSWNPSLTHAFSPLAGWIWESYQVQHSVAGDVVDFERAFTIPGEYNLDRSGNIYITCDNGYALFLNGDSIGSAQVSGEWRDSDLTQTYVDTTNWQSVENHVLTGSLDLGVNTLRFETANEQMNGGTLTSNPGGLIYEAEVCYDIVDQEETAWGDGTGFPGASWATWFEFLGNPAD